MESAELGEQVILVLIGGALPLTAQAIGGLVALGREKRAEKQRARDAARDTVKRTGVRSRLAWLDCVSFRTIKPVSPQHGIEQQSHVRANMREFMEIWSDMVEYGGNLERTSRELFEASILPASQDPEHKKLSRAFDDFQAAVNAWLKADAEGRERPWWKFWGAGTTPAQTAPNETCIERNGPDETGDESN